MADLDLRPLSLGEILDRTFSLYRRHFLLFLGINALPQLLVLALKISQTLLIRVPSIVVQRPSPPLKADPTGGLLAFGFGWLFVGVMIYFVAYLFSQGGTVFAVSELYLGRSTTIGASLSSVKGHLWTLFFVMVCSSLAIGVAFIFLIVPGIYLACRLCTSVPAALLEDRGVFDSLSRSQALTKDNAGRAFVIYLLYFIMIYAAMFLFMFPFAFLVGINAKDPSMVRVWLSLTHVGEFLGSILVKPFLTIATAVFYYDLRVRKEAFDLQFMMNPAGNLPSGNAGVPHTFA